jgi:molybdopterin/thiamine biosynthesis adenylyltransferase
MKLNNEEINRYSRHLTLPEVGMAGQLEIKESRVLMIGAGGLGSPLGMYLGAVGVGKIGLVDFDVVDHTNLHRQIAHTTADEGRPKVESLRDTILAGNPNIEVEIHNTRLERDNVLDLFSQYDIIADGSDNFETRYLINDAAFFSKKSQFFLLRPEARVTVVFILNLRRQRSFRVELLQVSWACSRA